MFDNGASKTTSAFAPAGIPDVTLTVLVYNQNGTLGGYFNGRVGFFALGRYISDAGAAHLYTCYNFFTSRIGAI
jgi:hypothetical protein